MTQIVWEAMRGDVLLYLLPVRKNWSDTWRSGQFWLPQPQDAGVWDTKKREEGNWDHNPGFETRELWLFQRSTCKSAVGYGPGMKSQWRELVDFQGLPAPSSGSVHPYVLEIKSSWQEACMDQQGAPDKTQT